MSEMVTIPEVIYLTWYGDVNTDGGEVTWEREKKFYDDVKYIRAEAAEERIKYLEGRIRALVAAMGVIV